MKCPSHLKTGLDKVFISLDKPYDPQAFDVYFKLLFGKVATVMKNSILFYNIYSILTLFR